MDRVFVIGFVASSLLIVRLAAQAPASATRGSSSPPAVFEVATIKTNKSGGNNVRFGFQPGGRFTGINVSLQTLVRNAYRVQSFEIVGGPSWLATDRFDIEAKAAENVAPAQMLLMVQAMLADRFKLALHREARELPIYALTLARADGRLGPQLKPSTTDCEALLRTIAPGTPGGAPPPPAPANARPTCGIRISGATLIAGGTTMVQLASTLSNAVGRTVVDRTALKGGYDVDLSFTPDQTMLPPDAPPINPGGPSLFTAVTEQLGLKLESTKGPVDVIVIDSAEKPSEN